MTRFVTFGEVMGRLCPRGFLRFAQTLPGSLEVTFAGAEANVAASLAMLECEVAFVTALPKNPIADACVSTLRGLGIDTSRILRRDAGRLGLYFVEAGSNQRPSRVIYDREASTISRTSAEEYQWTQALEDADWLHVTGITPSLSRDAADATIAAARTAKARGMTVSCDLNYRAKLWNWEEGTPRKELAGRIMRELLASVDVLIANEADCSDVLGIHPGDTDVDSGSLELDAYPQVARRVSNEFPHLKTITTTLRESISASHNNWGAMLFDVADDRAHFAPECDGRYEPYEIRSIVDRVGGGDAFAAGLLFARNHNDYESPAAALRFATAASCLAHSVSGDFNFASRAEIDALAGGSASGRVVR